ncbi:MAG TPA: N-acetylglucosamine-6-phosphate deacetylase [Clostridiaceae bacterium]|nr:N-acetylglucosamine-6-phosphate deacetylase [Clostridiaceae bacterium]
MHYLIYADRFFFEKEIAEKGYLEIIDGFIGDYYESLPADMNLEIRDFSDFSIAPGLVDTHIHGFMGHDFMDLDGAGILEICKKLPSTGVTSFLPTSLTDSIDNIETACRVISENANSSTGAKIQGIYLEGPFFTEKYKGAQNPKYFSDPDLTIFNQWQSAANGLIKKIAIAPEREGAIEFIKALNKQGIVVALGHSDASYAQAVDAVEAGAGVFVHLFNGMNGLHHRNPGMVGACFNRDDSVAELICDGHHVHPGAVEVVIRAKTTNRVALITDSMRAAGMPDGEYNLGEFPVILEDGAVRLTDGTNNLAGSCLKLIDAVNNVIDWGIAPQQEAIKMATLIPAESSGIADVCGRISKGYPADFIVLDRTMKLYETYIDGICVFQTNSD